MDTNFVAALHHDSETSGLALDHNKVRLMRDFDGAGVDDFRGNAGLGNCVKPAVAGSTLCIAADVYSAPPRRPRGSAWRSRLAYLAAP